MTYTIQHILLNIEKQKQLNRLPKGLRQSRRVLSSIIQSEMFSKHRHKGSGKEKVTLLLLQQI
jgi:hypothetical protein